MATATPAEAPSLFMVAGTGLKFHPRAAACACKSAKDSTKPWCSWNAIAATVLDLLLSSPKASSAAGLPEVFIEYK